MTRYRFLFMIAVAAIASSHPAHAGIVVGTCTAGTQYSTIQAAVNAAPSGATISVCPGGYPEQIVITKPLTLQGLTINGDETAMILPPAKGLAYQDNYYVAASQILVKDTTGVTLTNLVVDAVSSFNSTGTVAGIVFHDASGTVNRVAVQNQNCPAGKVCTGLGLLTFLQTTSTQTITVENSDFRNQGAVGIYAIGDGLTVNTINNFVAGPDNSLQNTIGIGYSLAATGSIQNNRVINEVFANAPSGNPDLLSTGIALDCASATVSGNTLMHTQIGVRMNCDTYVSYTGNSSITANLIFDTRKADAIYVGDSGNQITSNTIVAAGQSGIHFDSTKIPANGNTASGNSISHTCAGILTTGNATNTVATSNTYYTVDVLAVPATSCGPLF